MILHKLQRKTPPLADFKLSSNPWIAMLAVCVALGLFVWAVINYRARTVFYGPRAIYSLIILSLFLAMAGRIMLLRLLRTENTTRKEIRQHLREAWQPLFLFDLAAPFYLAAGVLIDVPAAVLTALITQAFLQIYTCWRGFVKWTEVCYRIATIALVVLISDTVYIWVAGPTHKLFTEGTSLSHISESREFLGSIVAACIMLVLIAIVSIPLMVQTRREGTRSLRSGSRLSRWQGAWEAYLNSPALRFQLLVLSVGPLMPVVDIFDDLGSELAWLFFLIPLGAIYYLALISTRLSIRTDELQSTLEDLRMTRRRRDELHDYATLITRAQEEERRRLARDLHDDTAQALIALSLGLDGLGRAMGKLNLPEKDKQWLSNLQNLADSTLEGVRRACRDLRPSVLDDLGLRAALEWLSDSSAPRGVPCTFLCKGIPLSTSPEAEIAIFRIVQEALTNIWKHSHATEAKIVLEYLDDCVRVSVSDNGKGFDSKQSVGEGVANTQSGLGLNGMRERAMLIGSQLSILSSPGNGCSIILLLPV